MSDEYTPTTKDVRGTWESSLMEGIASDESKQDANWDTDRMVEQFDRWLAKVKAEAQVEALEDLATAHYLDGPQSTYDTIMRRADRIAREAGIETGADDD